jgi:TPR repeat protein
MVHRTEVKPALVRLAASLGAVAAALVAAPLSADVKAGVDAWSAGNYDAAVAEWQGPARNGDADALFNLAQAYRLGRGVDADVNRARELYAEAAQKGHVKAADNYGLLLFQQGEQETAMPLIRDAADRGDPRAQYVLGLAHFNADYAQKDWVRAYALLTLANSAGLPQATAALAQMDQYVPMNQRQAAQSLARELESAAAQRRSAELAALDLGTSSVPAAPVPTAAQPAAAPAEFQRASASPAPSVATPVPVRAAQPVRPVPMPAAQAPAGFQRAGNWRVQLGAFGVAGNADRLWAQLQSNPILAGTRKDLVSGGNVTRLQAVGFTSRAEAQAACDTLKRQGQGCIVKQP